MKTKTLCSLMLALSIVICSCLCVSAETDEQFIRTPINMSDVNGDGKTDAKDLLMARKYLAKYDVMPVFENSDLDGDASITSKDVLLLRKYLAKYNVTFKSALNIDNIDITSKLEDLGKPNEVFWSDGDYQHTLARNPYDMIAYHGRVFTSAGNYDVNLGPVNPRYITRNTSKFRNTTSLSTEQVDRFYVYDDILFCLATDPTQWLTGEYYEYSVTKNKWSVKKVLKQNIHCYDMIKHNGELFFAGSNVSYDNPNGAEYSMGTVFCTKNYDPNDFSKTEYYDVPFINKYGEVIEYSNIGVPRVFEIFEQDNELYAYYYDYCQDLYKKYTKIDGTSAYEEEVDFNGVYKFNDEKCQFEFCKNKTLDPVFLSKGYQKDHESIMRELQWDDRHVFINTGLFTTTDFEKYNEIAIPGYENYTAYDLEVIGDKLYILVNVETKDGNYNNVLLETEDLETYRTLLSFDTLGFVRSFTYCDGAFYFSIGTTKAQAQEKTAASLECGRMYRYKYYN